MAQHYAQGGAETPEQTTPRLEPTDRVRENADALRLWEEIAARTLTRRLTVTGYQVAGKPATFTARVEEDTRYGFRTVTQVSKEGSLTPNQPQTSPYNTLPTYLLEPRNGETAVFLRFQVDSVTLTDPRGRASHRVAVEDPTDRGVLEDLEQLCRVQSGTPNLFDLAAFPPRAKLRGRELTADRADGDAQDEAAAVAELDGPYTIDAFQAYRKRLLAGDVTAAEHKAEFRLMLEAKEEFVAALVAAHRAPALKRMARRLGDWRANEKKKAENAESIHRFLAQTFVIDESFTWSPTEETWDEAATRLVDRVTDERLNEYTRLEAAVAEERQEAKDRRAALIEKALTSPETEEEFAIFCEKKGGEDALSLEQLEALDRLRAERTRTERREAKQTSTVEQLESAEGVELKLIETKHTRDGYDLFVVQLQSRVERETYRELLGKARELSGWYSRYARGGAVPGFQFRKNENAEAFMSLLSADVDRTEVLEDRRRRKELSAGERLKELAATLEERARGELSADRLENTARRADMAAGIRGRARADIALAETTRRIGEALEDGSAVFLDGVRNRAQVALLVLTLRKAVYARERKEREGQERNGWDSWSQPDDQHERRTTPEDLRHLEYPYPCIHASCLRRTLADADKRTGMVQASSRMAKRLPADDSELIPFDNERDIDELLSFIAKAKDRRVDTQWIERGVEDFKRMRAANIHTLPELRAAARELLPILVAPEGEDPIKEAERELVGRAIPGFFPTPPAIVYQLLEAADIEPGHRVLEPSCGKGDIMDGIRREHPDAQLSGIEFSATLLDILEAKGHEVTQGDFLEHRGHDYDRIVMNPPFENGQDIDHVCHAFERLAPGGRVVAVMSEGPFFREDHKSRAFREWLQARGGRSEQLPDDAFSGADSFRKTGVTTRMVVLDRGAT